MLKFPTRYTLAETNIGPNIRPTHTNKRYYQKPVFQPENKTVRILKFSTSLYIYTPTIEFYDSRVNISIVITSILIFYAHFLFASTWSVKQ